MAETANIAAMAEFISENIFFWLGWTRCNAINENWGCVNEAHARKTHPADVVYSYPEPYKNSMTYILCDLKSYGKQSISKSAIKEAISNLNDALSCAKISQDWRNRYVSTDKNYYVKAMLFIYNHDDNFQNEAEFMSLLHGATRQLKIDSGNVIYVFGPHRIQYFSSLINNLIRLRGEGKIPIDNQKIGYYYPEQFNNQISHNPAALPLTLENVSGSFHIMRYNKKDSDKIDGIDIYIEQRNTSQEGFMYILDYIRKNNILQDEVNVRIFAPIATSDASRNAESAKRLFTENLDGKLKEKMMSLIKYESCPTVIKHQQFSEEIGMKRNYE